MEVDRLILALQDFSSSSDLDRNCIVNSLNPLLLCITAAELCGAVSGPDFPRKTASPKADIPQYCY